LADYSKNTDIKKELETETLFTIPYILMKISIKTNSKLIRLVISWYFSGQDENVNHSLTFMHPSDASIQS